jgi:hypothetical protein
MQFMGFLIEPVGFLELTRKQILLRLLVRIMVLEITFGMVVLSATEKYMASFPSFPFTFIVTLFASLCTCSYFFSYNECTLAHPSHAETVLVIDTRMDVDQGIISELIIHRAANDTDGRKNYKWLGGTIGADGNIYCPACDTSAILKINVKTDQCETLGFTGTDKNKWQGGILGRDNCIYCIPANGLNVCRIATDKNIEDGKNPVQMLGNLSTHKDKWQGAAKGKDGSLYFIPENSYRVMRVTPPKHPPTIVDGKLPEDDVMIELM